VLDQPGDNQPWYLFALTQYCGNSSSNPSLAADFTIETVNYPLVRANTPALVATGPGRVGTAQAFNVRVAWDDPTFLQGDVRYGELILQNGTSPLIAANIPIRLERTASVDAAHALHKAVLPGWKWGAGAGEKMQFAAVLEPGKPSSRTISQHPRTSSSSVHLN
jgi:hypothetical protein